MKDIKHLFKKDGTRIVRGRSGKRMGSFVGHGRTRREATRALFEAHHKVDPTPEVVYKRRVEQMMAMLGIA